MAYPFENNTEALSIDTMVARLREAIARFPDKRVGENIRYSMNDVALSAFAIFYTQSPSWLSFQQALDEAQGDNNARTLFGVERIPSDNHVRSLLDEVTPSALSPVFSYVAERLHQQGTLEHYRVLDGQLLIALDATQTFSSTKISCKNCTVTNHRDGTTRYHHSAITPVIAAPGNPRVLPLEPEFIVPQDGHRKQDCESAATARWLEQYAARYSAWGATVLGDDLYSRQPTCQRLREQGLHFVLVCKPSSHKTLYEWVDSLEATEDLTTLRITRRTGKYRYTDEYRFASQVPLRDGEDAMMVNWCELKSVREDGKLAYHNAFVTDHAINRDNVAEIVLAGRTRWKIENENNNTLKTKGYNFSHNYGHGEKYLSSVLSALTLLAFLFHTVQEIGDAKYHWLRAALPRRDTFYQHIRVLSCYMIFDSLDQMLSFMIENYRGKRPKNLPPPDTS